MTLAALASHLGILPTADRWKVSQAINTILPKHWRITRLEAVASVQNGFPFESARFNTSRGIPLIRIRDIGTDDSETLYDGEYDDAFLVHAGDILVGMDGEFRCRRWRGRTGLLNQRVCRLRFNPDLVCENFFYLILQPYLSAIQRATSSVTVAHLSSKTIEQLELPVPPLAEQERIAAHLEALSSRRRRASTALAAVPPLLDKLRQSILAAAFRGDLTADWRAKNPDVEPADKLLARICAERRARWEATELAKLIAKGKHPIDEQWKEKYREAEATLPDGLGELPSGWQWTLVQDIAFVTKLAGFEYTEHVKYHSDGDLPVIKAENVSKRGFLHTEFSRVHAATVEHLTRSAIREDDVLMVFVGAGLGQVARVPPGESFFLGPNVAKIRCDAEGIIPELLEWFLRSPLGAASSRSESKATAQGSISMEQIRGLAVAVAPRAEQKVLLVRLSRMLASVERLSTGLKRQVGAMASLDQAVLAKAFRGELVPQDPRDAPASALLEHIHASRHNSTAARPRPQSVRVAAVRTAAVESPHFDSPSREPQPPLALEALVSNAMSALWPHGPLDKDAAVRRLADHLRDAGLVSFQRLRADGPLYTQLADAIDAAVKAGHLDRPKRGQVRACKPDATAYTTDDWRHALLAVLSPSPTHRDDAIRAAAEWARDNCGLEFTRLRADGHIVTGLRSALNSAIRAKLITRIDATHIARAPEPLPKGQLSFTDLSPTGRGEPR